MKTLTIKTDALYDGIHSAQDFSWTGWRLPVFCQEFDSEQELFDALTKGDVTISLSVGGWLSDNSYQPDALELAGIEPWTCDDEECDHSDCYIDDIFDYLVESIKDGLILDSSENTPEFEIAFD